MRPSPDVVVGVWEGVNSLTLASCAKPHVDHWQEGDQGQVSHRARWSGWTSWIGSSGERRQPTPGTATAGYACRMERAWRRLQRSQCRSLERVLNTCQGVQRWRPSRQRIVIAPMSLSHFARAGACS
jgi:hypothetical protein